MSFYWLCLPSFNAVQNSKCSQTRLIFVLFAFSVWRYLVRLLPQNASTTRFCSFLLWFCCPAHPAAPATQPPDARREAPVPMETVLLCPPFHAQPAHRSTQTEQNSSVADRVPCTARDTNHQHTRCGSDTIGTDTLRARHPLSLPRYRVLMLSSTPIRLRDKLHTTPANYHASSVCFARHHSAIVHTFCLFGSMPTTYHARFVYPVHFT